MVQKVVDTVKRKTAAHCPGTLCSMAVARDVSTTPGGSTLRAVAVARSEGPEDVTPPFTKAMPADSSIQAAHTAPTTARSLERVAMVGLRKRFVDVRWLCAREGEKPS